GWPSNQISPPVGRYSLASSRAMVLLPLPLSPASATISRSPISRLTSSTACRVRRDSALPILKCLVRRSVRSSGSVIPAPSRVQEAPDQHPVRQVQIRLAGPAAVHHLRAARREPAARGRA